MAVYFIQAGEGGPVKIGTTRNVTRRLAAIQNGQANRCRILHLFEGGRAEELRLHLLYAAHRILGEWFRPADDVLAADTGLLPMVQEPSPRQPSSWSDEARVSAAAKRAKYWADPEWVAKRKATYAANGPRLAEARWWREVNRLADVAIAYHQKGQGAPAQTCFAMAQRPLARLSEITGIPAAELRPDLAATFAPQPAQATA